MPWEKSDRRARLPKDWPAIRQRILRRDGYRCRLCGAPASDVDHIERGDNHDPSNLRALCKPCHTRKSAEEGRQAQGFGLRYGEREAHPGLIEGDRIDERPSGPRLGDRP